MPADDESSRKKRGAENQLTQHNWENDEDEDSPSTVANFPEYSFSLSVCDLLCLAVRLQLEGGFTKAPTEELAKRKIVKARRSCKTSAAGAEAPADSDKTEVKPAAFSWTASTAGEPFQIRSYFVA